MVIVCWLSNQPAPIDNRQCDMEATREFHLSESPALGWRVSSNECRSGTFIVVCK